MHPSADRVAAQDARIRKGIAFGQRMDAMVPASKLSQADKGAVWREIKAHHPERVAFFADPTVKRLMAAGAVPCFPPDLVAAAIPSSRGTKP